MNRRDFLKMLSAIPGAAAAIGAARRVTPDRFGGTISTYSNIDDLPSYLHIARKLDPDVEVEALVELLAQDNPILDEAMKGRTRTRVRTSLPVAKWRKMDEPIDWNERYGDEA